MDAAELHQKVETAFNAGDVEGLVSLYEPDARMLGDDGSVAVGLDAIRAVWSGFLDLGGRIAMSTRYAVEAQDVALLSNQWTFTMEGASVASAVTAEIARRQPDGSWRYVVDNPYSAPATSSQ
jgi:uncharacterized protein (TIGR02246 family)